jgi:hypothetical protein
MAVIIYGPVINSANNSEYQDILVSTVDPVVGNGKDGDIWFKYTP